MNPGDVLLPVSAVVLVFVAGVCAAADAALSRVSRVHVDDYVRDNRRGAVALRKVIAEPPRYLNVVLLLRVVAETTTVVLIAAWAIGRFGRTWETVLVTAAIMVVVSYVVIGVAPRTLGRQHADQVALAFAPWVVQLSTFLGPLPKFLIAVGNAVTPGRGFRDGPFTSEAELRDMVDLAEASKVIESDERQMIHSVFELGNTIVREVMVPRTDMVSIERTKTLRQAMSLALRSGFSRLPVVGENADDVVGIIYLRDLTARIYDHRESESTERVESLMRPATFVPDSKPVDVLLREMQAERIHLVVVVDEYGGTAGLATIEDILEEIVGEIARPRGPADRRAVRRQRPGHRAIARRRARRVVRRRDRGGRRRRDRWWLARPGPWPGADPGRDRDGCRAHARRRGGARTAQSGRQPDRPARRRRRRSQRGLRRPESRSGRTGGRRGAAIRAR